MLLTKVKVLSFGCYGTLVDRDSGVYAALSPLLTNGGISLSRAEVLAKFAHYEGEQQVATPQASYTTILAEVHRRLAADWGVMASEADHALFSKSVPAWPAFADVPAALQYLKRFYTLILLSNVDRLTLAGSTRRLEVLFDGVYTAQEIGSCKPDPAAFEYLAGRVAKLGVRRGQLLHVAHSLARDHVPAGACGLATAWIARPNDPASSHVLPGVRWSFKFPSLVDMVRAHQEELRS